MVRILLPGNVQLLVLDTKTILVRKRDLSESAYVQLLDTWTNNEKGEAFRIDTRISAQRSQVGFWSTAVEEEDYFSAINFYERGYDGGVMRSGIILHNMCVEERLKVEEPHYLDPK